MELKNELTEKLISDGFLKTPSLIEAFNKIDRVDFVIDYLKPDTYKNYPLAIGFGQTISQPATVAFMLEILNVNPGNKILDIGSGSGWQASLMAEVVGNGGKIFCLEIVPELCEFGKNNAEKYKFVSSSKIEFLCRDGYQGLAEQAPFDRIISAAAPEDLPIAWKEQLKIGGRMVWPMNNSLFLGIKKESGDLEISEFSGFIFVPLVRKNDEKAG